METIAEPMTHDHRQCDERFVATEQAVMNKAWHDAERLVAAFGNAMTRHFTTEEEQLFPAMEDASGQASAPIRIMTMEHDQMRHLIARLASAIGERDRTAALDTSETLLVIMQQHNMKEEHILYPMADRLVPALAERIAQDITEHC